LFSRSSRAYADLLVRERDAEAYRTSERKKFLRGDAPDLEDPYVRQVFAGLDPLAPGFSAVSGVAAPDFGDAARAVFLPLLAHREAGA
jgi:hypothetical protein